MIALKVQKIDDRIAVVLSEDNLAALHLAVGDTVYLETAQSGGQRETWIDDPHARGRAFLRRYNRNLAQLEG